MLLAIALAGIASHRNLIIILLGVELAFVASTILLVYGIAGLNSDPSQGFIAILSVWTVASVEIISLIAVYVYMKSRGMPLDVSKLSRMKW